MSDGAAANRWSGEQAERHLRSLELFGMRFGLDRMRRMMTVLGSPERRFHSIHVVGTNGKTSTTRMIAAILDRHGLRTGAYLSPHLSSYSERVQIGERDVSTHAFAAAVARAAWAAERVNRTLAEDDHVTQFELLTAAAFWEMAERGIEVAVIEAGLGGRYDATSVIDSQVAVLTGVGLEHTRWLGPTVQDIAAEKLAVVTPKSTLALAAGLDPDVLALAQQVARERDAQLVQVSAEDEAGEIMRPRLRALGDFQRRNFALARIAAEAYLRGAGIAIKEEAILEAGSHTLIAGRLQIVGDDPLTLLDGAHNPDAVRALAESLPALVAGRAVGLVLGVLDDKDAASMLSTLLPLCTRAWFTAPPSSRALSPAVLQSLARQLGYEEVSCEPHPSLALEQAQAWASSYQRGSSQERERPDAGPDEGTGSGAAVLLTGSIYLVGAIIDHLADAAHPGELQVGAEGGGTER